MTPEDAAKLRAEFPKGVIGKLPKPTHKDNAKGNCSECGKYHGLPAVHLDYVGHAATTDRLLQVDPNWTWEPMALGANGEPLMTNGGMWIKLTVCGVTRPGFGDGNSMKEVIGDAIRNAAMRFGVALDLWAKEDLHADEVEKAQPPATAAGSPTGESSFTPPTDVTPSKAQLERFAELAETWKGLSPEFNAAEAITAAEAKDGAWVRRASKKLEDNIAAKKSEAVAV